MFTWVFRKDAETSTWGERTDNFRDGVAGYYKEKKDSKEEKGPF